MKNKSDDKRSRRSSPGKILAIITIILLLPVILFGLLYILITMPFDHFRNKRAYYKSQYFEDFAVPYKRKILLKPEYRFYNSAADKRIDFKFNIGDKGLLAYFEYKGACYLLIDFSPMYFINKDTSPVLTTDNDSYDDIYKSALFKLGLNDTQVYALVERSDICDDLSDFVLPETLCLTRTYESAFDDEDDYIIRTVPKSAAELYEMMRLTKGLCGKFDLISDSAISWDLFEGYDILISAEGESYRVEISSGFFNYHMHENCDEIYQRILDMGRKGNVTVFRSGAMLYSGRIEDCPYPADKKYAFNGVRRLEAKDDTVK